MERERKQLKTASFVVLLFAGLSLLQIVTELVFGEINSAPIPEGAPENILLITKTILLVVSLVLLVPQVYVGIRGLRIAKNPNSSQRHIVLAWIIFAFLVLGLFGPAIAILRQEDISGNASTLFSILLEVVIYYDYIKYARAVAKLSD